MSTTQKTSHKAATHTVNPAIPSDWERNDVSFTGDEVIDAYFNGISVGKDQTRRIMANQFKENVEKATNLAEKVYNALGEKGYHPSEIHLKSEYISNFKALIVVSKDDFVADDFESIYSFARKIRNENETDTFFLTFSFIPSSKELNEACLASDGFFLKYDKRPVSSKARTT